jgi:hypothetical protein
MSADASKSGSAKGSAMPASSGEAPKASSSK